MSLTIRARKNSSAMARSIIRRCPPRKPTSRRNFSWGQLRRKANYSSIRPQTINWCQCSRRVRRRTLRTVRSSRASFRLTFSSSRLWLRWSRIKVHPSNSSSSPTTCLSWILNRTVKGSRGSTRRWCTKEVVWGPRRPNSVVLWAVISASLSKRPGLIRLHSTSQ